MNTQIYDKLAKLKLNEEDHIYWEDWQGMRRNGKPVSNPMFLLWGMSVGYGRYKNTKRGKQFVGKKFNILTNKSRRYWIITRVK